MSSFGNFLYVNGLKKKDVASFLGVSSAFITQICSGKRPLPDEKLALIKANKAWDSSMLESRPDSTSPGLSFPTMFARQESHADAFSSIGEGAGYIRRLLEENEELREENRRLSDENAVLRYQLCHKGESDAETAGPSFSASAV